MEKQRKRIINEIEENRNEMIKLSKAIHKNPEEGFKELKTVRLIEDFLKKRGFEVEVGYCGLPTAFKAIRKGRGPGPKVAFLAEYDAIAGIGHGAGHNVAAVSAIGAFTGLAAVMDDYAGEIALIGTPAGIRGGGKIALLEKGGFKGVDFAMLVQPSGRDENLLDRGGTASVILTITFQGIGSHASLPVNGVNSFTAVLDIFHQVDKLRGAFSDKDHISGVVLEGGAYADIIPEKTVCEFSIRARDKSRVEELIGLVKECMVRTSSLTKTNCSMKAGPICTEKYANLPLCEAFKENMSELGISMRYADTGKYFESSDIGNVSIEIPSCHAFLSITDKDGIHTHSREFADESVSGKAYQVCITGAIGLAMTGLDLLADVRLRIAAKSFHERQIPDCYRKDTGQYRGKKKITYIAGE